MKPIKIGLCWLLAGGVIYAGVRHFTNPAPFVSIVPPGLPAPAALVAVSGACEIAGGVGLLVSPLRRAAAWGLIALFVAVFPANVNMAINRDAPNFGFAPWMLWARLPLQALLIAWAWLYTRPDTPTR